MLCQKVNPRFREMIRTCANCGRLTAKAYRDAARPDGPAAWLKHWLEVSKGYRGERIVFMYLLSETIADFARQLGIDCDADRVFDTPLEIAIKIDDALNAIRI